MDLQLLPDESDNDEILSLNSTKHHVSPPWRDGVRARMIITLALTPHPREIVQSEVEVNSTIG